MKKKSPLIISDKEKPMQEDSWSQREFYRELVIKKYNPSKSNRITRLSEVLSKLPSGIVYKDETGMGATTLELKSKRNSIIVEPIKITASSKAFKHKALYVGSPTENYHPDKIENKHIHDYLINPKIKFKKIIVVADSLSRVIQAILNVSQHKFSNKFKETAKKNLNNLKDDKALRRLQNLSLINEYFLLIDEIDSFQLDSSYRRSMEDCLDAYKLFKKENRCMLSATDIIFTDPDLQDESLTIIKYNIPNKRQIEIITSGGMNLQGKAFDRIVETLKKYPNDKVLVAYNTVNGCYNLAENIRLNTILKNEEIAILCSVQSKEKVNEYFKELNSDKLPKRLNFITSAYFTGFDLHESFHLISISGNRSNTQALSERRLKQIAGRCRKGLLSETIIHDIVIGGTFRNANKEYTSAAKIFNDDTLPIKSSKKENKKIITEDPTKEDLIKAATEQVRSLDCMNKHYKNNKLLHEILEDVNDKFMRLLDEKQMRFVRRGQDKNLKISYLNIDAKLESLRVRKELYLFDDALTLKLKKAGHNVKTVKILNATEILATNISKHEKDEIIRQVIDKLKSVKDQSELEILLRTNDLTRFQKNIVRDFKRFYGYLDTDNILNKMEQTLVGQRDSRKYTSLLISAQIQTLPNGHIIIDRLKYYFKIGEIYSSQEILKRMTLFLLETGNTKKVKDEREAVRMLNNCVEAYRLVKGDNGTIFRKIKNYNPQNLISIAKREPLELLDSLL